MAFIPHTEQDIREMLAAIGVDRIDDVFDEIPEDLRVSNLPGVPEALQEMEVQRLMRERASADSSLLCFLGAGAYDHHIPAAVWEITTRGEYYTAYTPYQAEASQGTLQVIYEFQSMMSSLTGMDVSNASLYDGASALAEACLMAVRANRKSKSRTILVAGTVNPVYRRCVEAIAGRQGLNLETVPMDAATGTVDAAALDKWAGTDVTAVVIQQPSFLGNLEDVDTLTDWGHAQGALVIGVVNPMALALIAPPGEWGESGADIACGEGQPLGVPMSAGGPYYGLLTCRKAHVRQMPGRIVGRTVDLEDKVGYALTLQAREQHIRRSKATSNICTNQGLAVTASTIYMSLLGAEGLERVAAASVANANALADRLSAHDGASRAFETPHFHEVVIRLDRPVAPVLAALAERGILGGYDLSKDFPELGDSMLVCATETRTEADIDAYARAFADVMREARVA